MTAFYLLLIVLALLFLLFFAIWARYYMENKIWESRDSMPFVQYIPKEAPNTENTGKKEEAKPKAFEPLPRTENKPMEVEEEVKPVKVSTHKEREAQRKRLRNSIFIAEILKKRRG
ncbi:MAG: hypothetical protein ACKVTZ_13375 [Bacteroidia bacterium]